MPYFLLHAGSFAFLVGLCALSVASLRHRAPSPDADRNTESLLVLLVSGLAVGGFAIAHAGMNYAWTGHAQITDVRWLQFALTFVGSLSIAHGLLRLRKSRTSQIMLPAAAALALLGILTVYTWEVRDANSYISTEGLPAMRHYVAEAETSASTPGEAADLRELSASLPDEVSYELDPDHIAHGRFATALNGEWTSSYNDAVRRFRAHVVEGLDPPAVHRVVLYDLTQRQLTAVALAILLVPLWAWLCEPRRLIAMMARTWFQAGLAALLVGLTLMGVVLSRGAVPSLALAGDSVNTFEVLKVAIVLFVASASLWLRSRSRASPWPAIVLLACALFLPLAAFVTRDFGAALVLVLVTGSLLLVASSGAVRRMLFVCSVAAILALPAVLYLTPASLSPSVRSRLETWRDPDSALQASAEINLVNASLGRMADRELQQGTDLRLLPDALQADVQSVLQELNWRLQSRQAPTSQTEPFVPEFETGEEQLLVEAETIWQAIGGYEGTSSEAMNPVTSRLGELRTRFDEALDEFATRTAAVDQPVSPPRVDNTPDAMAATVDPGAVATLLSSIPLASDGFQLTRASHALAAGGLLGVGLGQGRPEAIPGVTEDAAFAVLGEALGFVGSVAIVLLLLALVQHGVSAFGSGRTTALGMVAAGFSLLIAAQALVALGGLLGLLPYTGVGFPFISRSGSGVIVNVFVVTVLAGLPAAQPQPQARLSAPAFASRRSRRGFIVDLGNAGVAACFGLFLFSVGSLQVGGRSVSPGAFLRSPVKNAKAPDGLDQWSGPLYYRTMPGPILDRNGVIMAQTHLDGLGWQADDPELAVSIGHIVEPLDGVVRNKATKPEGPPLGTAQR